MASGAPAQPVGVFGARNGPVVPVLHARVRAYAGAVRAQTRAARRASGTAWKDEVIEGVVEDVVAVDAQTVHWRIAWPALKHCNGVLKTLHGTKFWKRARNFPDGLASIPVFPSPDALGPDDVDENSSDSSDDAEDKEEADDSDDNASAPVPAAAPSAPEKEDPFKPNGREWKILPHGVIDDEDVLGGMPQRVAYMRKHDLPLTPQTQVKKRKTDSGSQGDPYPHMLGACTEIPGRKQMSNPRVRCKICKQAASAYCKTCSHIGNIFAVCWPNAKSTCYYEHLRQCGAWQ